MRRRVRQCLDSDPILHACTLCSYYDLAGLDIAAYQVIFGVFDVWPMALEEPRKSIL